MSIRKRSIADLAIFGGTAEFADPLHVGAPNLGAWDQVATHLRSAFERRRLTNFGPLVAALEDQLSRLQHAICVSTSSGTVALQIAAHALQLSGEVIVPSFTFVATVHALQWIGLTPIFCDVDPGTHTLDPAAVEKLITPDTCAIVGVHLWGRACDIDALAAIAGRRNLALIFDAAQAFGCSYRGRPIGGYGNATTFSFHATKIVNAFEGGAVTTMDPLLAETLRQTSNFGFRDYDEVCRLGTNAKMSEASAAMALASLAAVDEFVAINKRNYDSYVEGLSKVRGLTLLRYDPVEHNNYHYIVVEVGPESGVSRDAVHRILWNEKVLARRYYYPGCHRMEPYRSQRRHQGLQLPHTEKLATRVLCLPTGAAVGVDEIVRICELIRFVVERADQVAERLPDSSASIADNSV